MSVVVAAVGAAEGARGAAAALACADADADRAALLVDLGGRPPRPTLLASAAARQLEERLAAHLPGTRVAARGQVCHLVVPADEEGFAAACAAETVARPALTVILVPPASTQDFLASAEQRIDGVLLRADLATDRPLLALLVCDLTDRGLAVAVLKRRLGWVEERRALFGILGPEGGVPPRVRDRVRGRARYDADNEFRQARDGQQVAKGGRDVGVGAP